MIRILIVAITACLVIPHGACAQSPKLIFQTFSSPEGKFVVAMPGKPKKEIQEADSPVGKLKINTFMVAVSPSDLVYMLEYTDYPAVVAGQDPQIILKGGRDGMLRGQNKLIEDKEVVLGKERIPGRAILIDLPKLSYRGRLYIADTRLYQVIIIGSRGMVTSSDADKYLNSFKITK
jgi:hypothetical protein